MITAEVLGQSLILCSDCVVSDSVNYLTVKFIFSEEWNSYSKAAIFKNKSQDIDVSVIMDSDSTLCVGENTFLVPFEVIKSPEFNISVIGTNGDKFITTAEKTVKVLQSGYTQNSSAPAVPTPSEYQQIISLVNDAKNTAQSVRTDADNGVFKGEKGEQGVRGIQGIQGAKGDKGDKGDCGSSGFSPIVNITKSGKTATFSVTDANGTKTATLSDAEITNLDSSLSSVSENAITNKAVSNAFGGALHSIVNDIAITVNDVSEIEHNLNVTVESLNLANTSEITTTDSSSKNIAIISEGITGTFTIKNTVTYSSVTNANYGIISLKLNGITKYLLPNTTVSYTGTITDIKFINGCGMVGTIKIQILKGIYTADTMPDYTPYISDFSSVSVSVKNGDNETVQTVTSQADGTVYGLISVAPCMTISSDNSGAIIKLKYNVDVKKYIDEKIAELKSLIC